VLTTPRPSICLSPAYLASADYIGLPATDRLTWAGYVPPGGRDRRPGVTAPATMADMAAQVSVADASDPRLADYVSLTDVHLRRSLETAQGLFIAEGDKVIRRAIAAGYAARSFLVAADKLATIEDIAAATGAPLYVLPAQAAEQLTGFRVHRGALASMQRRPLPSVREVVAGARRIVVLEDIVDHANVGAVFRCVAALGFDAVVLAPRCADPLYRRAVKVSMGAVLAVPYARLADWHGGLAELRAAGFRLLALTPDPAAIPIGDVEPAGKLGVLVGSEGHGLSARWLAAADQAVRIPMRRGVSSLNVASAAAIACYLLAEG
jgi:tRNA G18 (ribose-2'-O)-methylase SpoU